MPIIKRKQSDKPNITRKRILNKPKLKYTFELFKLDKQGLSKFIFLKNRRKISNSTISSLKKLLYNAGHFNSPIVVNETPDGYKIIDGNHRIETLKQILSDDPMYSIEFLLIKYKNLDEDGEIEAFRMWNIGHTQSIDDFIQSIASKVPFIKWVKNSFSINVSIYKQPNTISFRALCNAYIAAKNEDDNGSGLKRENFAKELYDLKESDYDWLNNYCLNFSKVFGIPSNSNVYHRSTFFNACMYVVMEYDDMDLWQGLTDKVMGNPEVVELTSYGGRTPNRKMIGLIKDLLKVPLRLKK